MSAELGKMVGPLDGVRRAGRALLSFRWDSMPANSFVHLHCHSHYSLLDGANRIPELVEQTK